MPKISFTSHAADRYVERVRPDLQRREAYDYLESASRSAGRFRRKTVGGQELWSLEDCVLVTKHTDGGLVCVTILTLDQIAAHNVAVDLAAPDIETDEEGTPLPAVDHQEALLARRTKEAKRAEKGADRSREALRIAVMALRMINDRDSRAALDKIAAVDPLFVSDRFLEKKTA